jgi:hypothetical protein
VSFPNKEFGTYDFATAPSTTASCKLIGSLIGICSTIVLISTVKDSAIVLHSQAGRQACSSSQAGTVQVQVPVGSTSEGVDVGVVEI